MKKYRYAKISTCFLFGIDGILADLEVTISPGLPSFEFTGLCDSSIKESRERVRVAIRNSGYEFPSGRITASLSPAYFHKSGTSIDLPLALCILIAAGQIHMKDYKRLFAYGELTLTGFVLDVPGSMQQLQCAARAKSDCLIIPLCAISQANLLSISAYGVDTLKDAIAYMCSELTGEREPNRTDEHIGLDEKYRTENSRCTENVCSVFDESESESLDFSILKGQEKTGRGIILSAAGFHSILMTGSPGSGKTTAARILCGLLPELSREEQLDLLCLRSVERTLCREDLLSRKRPFRFVHHTCTASALIGGGINPKPGELSLSMHGILFLDEMAEFSPRVLDLLRQPMEKDSITISRAGSKVVFPTKFLLVGAMNPCRCGKYLDAPSKCSCNERQRNTYSTRISGPILDRIDIFTELYFAQRNTLIESAIGKNTHATDHIRKRIEECWQIQYDRCDRQGVARVLNGNNRRNQIAEIFEIQNKTIEYAVSSAEKLMISSRGINRLLRLSRTIADYEANRDVSKEHVCEALQYRSKQGR